MKIYHWRGEGYGHLQGVREYIELYENEAAFIGECKTKEEAIADATAPGFHLEREYDTETDTDFSKLPLDQTLIVWEL